MTATQQDLFPPTSRATGQALATKLLAYLIGREWQTRKQLRAGLGFTARECRLGRQHSKGRVIMGQQGFKASCNATLDELRICANTLNSQAMVMNKEASEIYGVLHGRREVR